MNNALILSIDSGTTSTKVTAYDQTLTVLQKSSRPTKVTTDKPGWSSIDPIEIWTAVHDCLEEIDHSGVATVGVTNQRESIICWDAETKQPLCQGIVWHDSRTAKIVERYSDKEAFKNKTGLPINTYFSAVKIRWMLENEPEVIKKVEEKGQESVRFGTVDSWIIMVGN